MRHINYNHLFYFWNVAEAGSIVGASKNLYLTPQTISTQLKLLEESTGTPLFEKAGRGLTLTKHGKTVKGFANEIFTLGAELSVLMRGGDKSAASDLNVGIVETLPKIAVEKFLEPAFDAGVRLCCTEASLQGLVADLHAHRIDLILSDQSIPTGESSNTYVHSLGTSQLALFAASNLMARLADRVPDGLSDAPVLFPSALSPLRRAGEDWFLQQGIAPRIVAECSDSGLIKAMAAAGRGMFIAPLNIRRDIEQSTGCKVLAVLDGFVERYFAITLEKRIKNPVVNEIADSARTALALT